MTDLPEIRRVALIGDVHCQDAALHSILQHTQTQNLDATFCVGDIIDGPGDADRTCQLLSDYSVTSVAGNHERWFLAGEMRNLPDATLAVNDKTRAFLNALPRTRRFRTPVGELMLCHGVGEDDLAELRPDSKGFELQAIASLRDLMTDETLTLMVGGHTHERMIRAFDGITVINAGTIMPGKYQTGFWICDFTQMRGEFYPTQGPNIGAPESQSIVLR